mgnify:FL=1
MKFETLVGLLRIPGPSISSEELASEIENATKELSIKNQEWERDSAQIAGTRIIGG